MYTNIFIKKGKKSKIYKELKLSFNSQFNFEYEIFPKQHNFIDPEITTDSDIYYSTNTNIKKLLEKCINQKVTIYICGKNFIDETELNLLQYIFSNKNSINKINEIYNGMYKNNYDNKKSNICLFHERLEETNTIHKNNFSSNDPNNIVNKNKQIFNLLKKYCDKRKNSVEEMYSYIILYISEINDNAYEKLKSLTQSDINEINEDLSREICQDCRKITMLILCLTLFLSLTIAQNIIKYFITIEETWFTILINVPLLEIILNIMTPLINFLRIYDRNKCHAMFLLIISLIIISLEIIFYICLIITKYTFFKIINSSLLIFSYILCSISVALFI